MTVTRFDGCFRLAAKHSGKVMYPGLDNTIKVQPLNTDSKDQVWALQPAGSGSFRLISAVNGKAVQYYNGSSLSLVPVSQTLAQQFSLVPQAEANTYRLDPLDLVNIDANNPLATPQPHSVEATDDGLWAPLTTGGTNQFFVLSPATCPFTLPADCGIRLVATDATGKETDRLPRKAGTTDQFDPLTIRAESLSDTPLTGALYSWSLASGAPSNASSLTATQRGVYSLTLSAAGQTSVCQTNITLSATPCSSQTAPYGECKNVNLTAPANTVGTARLFVGDSFNAGDYVVRITDLSGGASGWSGKGTVSMTLFGGLGLPVSVIFANAVINDCLEMVGGSVTTQYDPAWSNIVPIELFTDLFKDLSDQLKAAYQGYKGSDAEKVKIRELNTRYEAALADEALTEEQKQRLKAEYDAYKQQSEALLNCTQPTGCPTADQLSQRVDDLQKIADDIAEENKPDPNAWKAERPVDVSTGSSGGRLGTTLVTSFKVGKVTVTLKNGYTADIKGGSTGYYGFVTPGSGTLIKYSSLHLDGILKGFYQQAYLKKNPPTPCTASQVNVNIQETVNQATTKYPKCAEGLFSEANYQISYDLLPSNTIEVGTESNNALNLLRNDAAKRSNGGNSVWQNVKYQVFVTDFGTAPADRAVVAKKANNPTADEVILWVDYPQSGPAKYEYFFGVNIKKKIGDDKSAWDKVYHEFLRTMRAQNLTGNPFEKMLNGLGTFIGSLTIPQEYWDCTDPNYTPIPFVVNSWPQSAEGAENFAFTCGLWNGAVGQVSGTAKAAGKIADAIGKLPDFLVSLTDEAERTKLKNKISATLSMTTITRLINEIKTDHVGKTSCALQHQIGKDIIDVAALVFAVKSAVKGMGTLVTSIQEGVGPMLAKMGGVSKRFRKGGSGGAAGFDVLFEGTPTGPPVAGSGGASFVVSAESGANTVGLVVEEANGITTAATQYATNTFQNVPSNFLGEAKTAGNVSAPSKLTYRIPSNGSTGVGQVAEPLEAAAEVIIHPVPLPANIPLPSPLVRPASGTGTLIAKIYQGVLKPIALVVGSTVVLVAQTNDNCTECSSRNPDAELCRTLARLRTKGAANGIAGITKLCSTTLGNNDLKDVANKVLSMTDAQVVEFMGDYTKADPRMVALTNHKDDITVSLVDTWAQLFRSNYEERFDYLYAVKRVLFPEGSPRFNRYEVTEVRPNYVKITTNNVVWNEFVGSEIRAVGGTGTQQGVNTRNQLLNLVPLITNVTYIVDSDFTYRTDAAGRVDLITGRLWRGGDSRRDNGLQGQAKIEKHGKTGDSAADADATADTGEKDDGGHMIGARFHGPVEQINYFPQNALSNRIGTWKTMENEWARVRNGTQQAPIGTQRFTSPVEVRVIITPTFTAGTPPNKPNEPWRRPEVFFVRYFYGNTEQTDANNPNYLDRVPNP